MVIGVGGVIITLKFTLRSGSNFSLESCRSYKSWGIEKQLLLADIVNGSTPLTLKVFLSS